MASRLSHRDLQDRVRAGRTLAKHPGAEPWLVLLFLSSQTVPTGDELEQARQRGLQPFELAVVAVTVEALPQDVPSSVLLSLTFLLNEQGHGIWAEKSGVILVRKSSHSSRPIRELARACLKDRLGVDHGWDGSAWRAAITGPR